jgi:hypothetical protein
MISRKCIWAPVAHTCDPSYSGGGDQEDHDLKPAWAKQFTRPHLKKPFTKIGLVEWLKVKALSSSPQYQNKRKYKPCFASVCVFHLQLQ